MTLLARALTKTASPPKPPAVHSDKWLIIHSEILGEDLLYVRDPQHLAQAKATHPDLVTYFDAEVEALANHQATPEAIQAAHVIKKKFGGRVREVISGRA